MKRFLTLILAALAGYIAAQIVVPIVLERVTMHRPHRCMGGMDL